MVTAYDLTIQPDANNSWIYTDTGVGIDIKATSASIPSKNAFRIRTDYTGTPNTLFTVLGSGDVGIGTASPCGNPYAPPACKLSVAGAIQAQEIVVNTGWSDYVFGPNYRLRSLAEVDAYIQANHHLPEIPSEAEVKERGVRLGEMQSKLLAKVEELTLHMIELEKENGQLKQSVKRLEEAGLTPSSSAQNGRTKPQ